jgi:hypothetical protein
LTRQSGIRLAPARCRAKADIVIERPMDSRVHGALDY